VQRLGFYEVLGKLGEGGMGTVYRARDRRSGEVLAVKVLNPERQRDLSVRKRFLREALVGQRIAHPNVVGVREVGEVHLPGLDRTLYLAMELVPGRDLHQRLSFEELDQRSVVELGLQIAQGLAAAHGHGVIHRDLKPHNVLVSAEGVAKILDFGLAQVADDESQQALALDEVPAGATQRGVVIGTLGYAAPEQLESSRVDPRADLFSLGALLHQLLTGRLPFAGTSHFEVLANVERVRQGAGEPPRPSHLQPGVAPALDELVAALLAVDREARPGSAERVALELSAILENSEAETIRMPRGDRAAGGEADRVGEAGAEGTAEGTAVEGTEPPAGGRWRRLVRRVRGLLGG
jgi:eukaryotic-like serine/threonine-protein kinase